MIRTIWPAPKDKDITQKAESWVGLEHDVNAVCYGHSVRVIPWVQCLTTCHCWLVRVGGEGPTVVIEQGIQIQTGAWTIFGFVCVIRLHISLLISRVDYWIEHLSGERVIDVLDTIMPIQNRETGRFT